MTPIKLGVVIPTHSRPHSLLKCIESLRASAKADYELIIVNDGGDPITSTLLRTAGTNCVELISKSDLWWTASINLGLRYLLERGYNAAVLMNDDVTVDCGFLDTLEMAHRQFPDSVIVSKILDENGAVWALGGDVSWPFRGERHITAMTSSESSGQRVLWSPGMGTLIPTQILTTIGLLDERNFPQYLSDADYGLRVTNAGYRILVSDNSIIRNNTQTTGGVSSKTRMKLEDLRFILFDYRSADYLKARAAFIYRHAPRGLRTISLVTRLAKIAAFSLKRMIR